MMMMITIGNDMIAIDNNDDQIKEGRGNSKPAL